MTWLRAMLRHTPLMLALGAGSATAALLALAASDFAPLTRTLIASDAATAVYLVVTWLHMRGASSSHVIVTLHGVLAFVFNTVILALTINLAAVLFSWPQ